MKKEKKRLVIGTDCFYPRKDGIARFLAEIIPFLKEHFEVTILAPEYPGKIDPQLIAGIELIRFPLSGIRFGDFSPARPGYSKIKNAIMRADIVWTQTLGPIGAMTIHIAKSKKKPIACYIHSIENELITRSIALRGLSSRIIDHLSRGAIRRFYNKADVLMVPFEQAASILSSYGVKTHKEIVHLAVNADSFKPSKSKSLSKARLKIPGDLFVVLISILRQSRRFYDCCPPQRGLIAIC